MYESNELLVNKQLLRMEVSELIKNKVATLFAICLTILNLQLIKSHTKKEFDWNYDPDTVHYQTDANWTKLDKQNGSSSANTYDRDDDTWSQDSQIELF